MENNRIIIALLIVIIVLLVVLGIFLINPADAKIGTELVATSNNTLSDRDCFSIALTDVNGTPLANQSVDIIIADANGAENPQNITTDDMGNGILELNGLTPGNYTFNVTYGGNDNYSGCNLTQKIQIKEAVQETSSQSTGNAYVDTILNDPNCYVVRDPFSICPRHGVPYYQDNYCDWFINP